MEDTLLRELETAVSEYDYRISKSSITADLAAYNKEKKKIEDKRKRLADLYEDDMITKEEYQQRRDALRDKERDLKALEAARSSFLQDGKKRIFYWIKKTAVSFGDERSKKFWSIRITK